MKVLAYMARVAYLLFFIARSGKQKERAKAAFLFFPSPHSLRRGPPFFIAYGKPVNWAATLATFCLCFLPLRSLTRLK